VSFDVITRLPGVSTVSSAPRRSALRSRAEYAVVTEVQKVLGSLPVVAEFSRRIGIAEIIDKICPVRELAQLTNGQVIEALIANRLSCPTAMVRVADWAQEYAVEEVYGFPGAWLNDDRIARALDAIAPHVQTITGTVGATAIRAFGIDVTRIHWDMTSISLYGDYDGADTTFPTPGYGHPKDRRTDLKQIQAGLAVTADGGIPVWHNVYDGGANEVTQVVEAMNELRKMAKPPRQLLVGDCKLISHDNVTAMTAAGMTFIAPLAAARVPDGLFAGLDKAKATPVSYIAQRDLNKPAARVGTYRVLEDTMTLTGRRKSDPIHQVRRILVHSSANAVGQSKNRAKKLARGREDLDKLVRTAGTRYHPDHAAVTAKIDAITRKRGIGAYLVTTITINNGKPVLTWNYNQDAIDAEAATDGWYALLTNLPPDQADASEVFTRYKDQSKVEHRYSNAKGPLAVAPLFLQNNQRITALITVICLALLVYCLIEREVRANLAPDTTMRGFYPDNRAVPPTAQLILNTLARMKLIPADRTNPPRVIPPNPLQTRLLALLHVDPTRPRWTA
jgi:transposase